MSLNLVVVSGNKLSVILGYDTVLLPTFSMGAGFSMSGAEKMQISVDFDQCSNECPEADIVFSCKKKMKNVKVIKVLKYVPNVSVQE